MPESSKLEKILRTVKRAAMRLGYQKSVRVGGRKYLTGMTFVEPWIMDREWEPWMDAVYAAALSLKQGVVVDVGVNRMQTLFQILQLDSKRRYVGFEPQIKGAFAARDFARRNNLSNVEIICAGLSDSNGLARLNLFSDSGFDGAASIDSDGRHSQFYKTSTTIPVIQGDLAVGSLCLEEICLLNVDVEGAELEVLRGLEKSLARLRPVVTFEVLNDWRDPGADPVALARSARKNAKAEELGALLTDAGLSLFSVRHDGLKAINRIEREINNDLSLCNYVGVPREHADSFVAATRRHISTLMGSQSGKSGEA